MINVYYELYVNSERIDAKLIVFLVSTLKCG